MDLLLRYTSVSELTMIRATHVTRQNGRSWPELPIAVGGKLTLAL